MKVLVAFHWNCGRMGDVEGLFVTTKEELQASYDKGVYFGEILGKHSDIEGTLDPADITIKSEDQDFIAKLVDVIGCTTISGYNPLSYLREEDEDEEE